MRFRSFKLLSRLMPNHSPFAYDCFTTQKIPWRLFSLTTPVSRVYYPVTGHLFSAECSIGRCSSNTSYRHSILQESRHRALHSLSLLLDSEGYTQGWRIKCHRRSVQRSSSSRIHNIQWRILHQASRCLQLRERDCHLEQLESKEHLNLTCTTTASQSPLMVHILPIPQLVRLHSIRLNRIVPPHRWV